MTTDNNDPARGVVRGAEVEDVSELLHPAPSNYSSEAPATLGQSSSAADRLARHCDALGALFCGADTRHGTYDLARVWLNEAKGKLEIKDAKGHGPRTEAGGPTPVLWREHLAGRYPLGVLPQREDGTCRWGAIDIDLYADLQPGEVLGAIVRHDLPLIACRSKSGGMHLFVFSQDWVPAADMVAALVAMRDLLGLDPDTEVFPKNSASWVNMPFFDNGEAGEHRTVRYAYKPHGLAMTVDEFLRAAHRVRKTPEGLAAIARSGAPRPRAGGGATEPHRVAASRCGSVDELVALVAGTATNRNEQLFAAAKRAGAMLASGRLAGDSDTLVAQLVAAAELAGLPAGEARESARNGMRHGQAKPDDPRYPHIAGITVLTDGEEESLFRVVLVGHGDRPMVLRPDEISKYSLFAVRCLAALHRQFAPLSAPTWAAMLDEALSSATTEAMPVELTQFGRFREAAGDFLASLYVGNVPDDLLGGRPYRDEDDGRTYFRLRDLARHLDHAGLRIAPERLAGYLRRLGGGTRQFEAKGKQIPAYWVPGETFDAPLPAPLPAMRGPAF